ncbi:methionine--tRNA ligase [Candidatus Pacearchaeota archaeon ex4484_71]|nr:MAG: methionine--tRNA ligase [Candidatus Pacearchaeota archaeon ex4484_71]
MKENKFYITTPIYYPNDVPHIGHAYTTVVADVLARWNKMLGKKVFFLTGTDEHGKKIADTARREGKNPQEFLNNLVPKFKEAWKKLNVDYSYFIRTTDKSHESVVKEMLQKSFDNGDIYLGDYEGLYCVDCERYYTEKDLDNGNCPIHKKPVEKLSEKTYFFKLSKYKDKLLEFYEKNPSFISPKKRSSEIINRVREGLKDLSISRTSFDWGVPLPFDDSHVAYVWFDALFNYYSAVKDKNGFWPADLNLVGKDILWFHAVYWPAFLMSVGLEIPKMVFAHGFWTLDSEKISKSRGKAIGISELIAITDSADSIRYFLCRAVPFGDDGDFSKDAVIKRHNGELLNKLGNLVSRTAGLIEKKGIEKCKNSLLDKIKIEEIERYMSNLELDKALNDIFSFIDVCNEYIQEKKPWETGDKKVLYEVADSIRLISILLWPFMPSTSEKISKQFGFSIDDFSGLDKPLDENSKIIKSEFLFNRVED